MLVGDCLRYFSQPPLTILRFVTVMWPCSVEFLPTPCSLASALVSSLAPCRAAFCTAPVTVMVWPTCFARSTLSLFTSQVLPSLASTWYSSPSFCKQPVTVRTFLWVSFFVSSVCARAVPNINASASIAPAILYFINPPVDCPYQTRIIVAHTCVGGNTGQSSSSGANTLYYPESVNGIRAMSLIFVVVGHWANRKRIRMICSRVWANREDA